MQSYEGYELDYGPVTAAQARASERAAFIRRTYAHLAGAVLALIGLTALLFTALGVEGRLTLVKAMVSTPWMWLIITLVWMGASHVARMMATARSSVGTQYAGLALEVVAWSVMFMPILVVVSDLMKQPQLIYQAGLLTAAVFGGLTMSVFITKKDYSFLGPILCVGGWIALGVIVCAILFGFSLGLFFSFAMVALIAGYILYNTSNVMHHWPVDMHVAAALELLSDVAILFWYILRILMSLNSRD